MIINGLTSKIIICIFDLPGHGLSSKCQSSEFADKCILFLNTIIEQFKLYTRNITLLGFSFGGVLIQHYAHVSNYKDRITKLILISTLPEDASLYLSDAVKNIFTSYIQSNNKNALIPLVELEYKPLILYNQNITDITILYGGISMVDFDAILGIAIFNRILYKHNNVLVIQAKNDEIIKYSAYERFKEMYNRNVILLNSPHMSIKTNIKEINTLIYNFI